ncbi:MAG TPA: hypothetical protein VG456_09510, partial [Candidatus Sulfopaludibacter sp.]|nr:hypothetical protein [Candidatus Sulfopaludibacter sp.]
RNHGRRMLTRCFFVKGSALVMAGAGQLPGVSVDAPRFAGKDAAAIAHELLHRYAGPETMGDAC